MRFLVCAALFPLVSAVKLTVPANTTAGSTSEITWISDSRFDPPTWSLFLMNVSEAFGLKGILGENIDPTPGKMDITLPAGLKASNDYVLKAVYPDNVDRAAGWSPVFAVTN